MKYNIDEFSEVMREGIGRSLGSEYDVSVERVLKNNSCEYYGIIIKHNKMNDDITVAPAIYIESWYERYLTGENVEDLEIDLLNAYRDGVNVSKSIQIDNINKDGVYNCLYYRIVNKKRNERLLTDSPYIEFLDFAITFHYLYMENCEGIQSFRITNKLMNDWEFNVQELFSIADNNMERLFPDKLQNISEIIGNLQDGVEYLDERMILPIYVLTNKQGINGAAALLYSQRIKELAEELETDFYVLPSSIHEVLLVPDNNEYGPEWLRNMVKEVNSVQVAPEEQLSDNVYYYTRKTAKIGICG